MSTIAPGGLDAGFAAGLSVNIGGGRDFLLNGSPSTIAPPLPTTLSAAVGPNVENTGTPAAGLLANFAGSFGDDWFERIHAFPVLIALGNLLSSQTRDIEVYNADRKLPHTLDAVIETNTAGITITKPAPEPLVFAPYESKIYQLGISTIGPATINAQYDFDFAAGINDATVIVTGTRVIVFGHDAERPIVESIEFNTDIMESYRGLEQRVMARDKARLSYEMDYVIKTPNEVSNVLNKVFGHLGLVFAVPVWPDTRALLADLAGGETVVPVDTQFADFRGSGGIAILWRAFNDFETVEVTTVDPNQLVLARPVEDPHSAANTKVIPLRLANGTDPVSHSRTMNGVTFLTMRWRVIEFSDLATPDGSLTFYKSLPVVDDLNFVSIGSRLEERIATKMEVLDNETGLFTPVLRRDGPELGSIKSWEPENTADLDGVRGLLYALRGRQRSFWMPTFRKDFELTSVMNSTDIDVQVSPVGYTRFVAGQEPIKNIAIYLNDGTVFFREITAQIELPGGDEQLTIDSALGQTVNPADILRISYLVRSRLNSDRITIRHNGIGRAIVRVPVAGVIQ